MINEPNTRYVIQYDFDLNEQEITIPENCILEFDGGSISGAYTITCNNTEIINPSFKNVLFAGSIKNEVIDVVAFGADNTDANDNAALLNNLFALASDVNHLRGYTYYFRKGTYKITSVLAAWGSWDNPIRIIGENRTRTVIKQYTDNTPVICLAERVYVDSLCFTYANQQPGTNTDATAISYKRLIYSEISNIDVYKAYRVFGFYNYDFNPGYDPERCIVNVNIRNIYCRNISGYFMKDVGGSGSVVSNVYYAGLGFENETKTLGCIDIHDGTSCTFDQFNIEDCNLANVPIIIHTTSDCHFTKLHLERVNFKGIIDARDQAFITMDMIDVYNCVVSSDYPRLFLGLLSYIKIDAVELNLVSKANENAVVYLAGQYDEENASTFIFNRIYSSPNILTYANDVQTVTHLEISRISRGTMAQRPVPFKHEYPQYFDTTLNKPIYYNGIKWLDSNGNDADVKYSGTTEQRPTDINIGFQYFDTTLNKSVWWNGTEWVDSEGLDSNSTGWATIE